MSAVYLVSDLQLKGALWALKQLNLGNTQGAERQAAIALFQREQEVLATLNHPGLPRFIDYFSETDGTAYLVMERVEGNTLQEILSARCQPLPASEAIPIALQVSQVLTYLHSQKRPVLYRDLKPSNLILQPTGRVRFIDFGIARYYDPQSLKDTQELGTPGYCAPEQYHGHSTPQSDLYALGVTLYYLLTLKDPQNFNFTFPPLVTLQPALPDELSQLLVETLDLDAKKRPASVRLFAKRLGKIYRTINPQKGASTQTLHPALTALAQHARTVEPSSKKVLTTYAHWLKTLWFTPASRRP